MTKSELTRVTGCQPMCYYFQYEILKMETLNNVEGLGGITSKPTKNFFILSQFCSGFQLVLANNELIEETEELIYNWVSFVSNFGGSLGLFVGFSFLMLYDWVVILLNFTKTIFVRKME